MKKIAKSPKKDKITIKKSNRLVLQLLITTFVIAGLIILNPHFKFGGFVIYQNQPDATEGIDTYIRNGSSTVFGTDTVLKVGKTASGFEYRSLVYLNISSVPLGSSILDSIATFYVSTNNQPNMTISAYLVTSDWLESEAVWNNNTASTLWTSSGGDYDSLILLDTKNISGAGQYYNYSITQAVRRWMNGTNSNYGIILVPYSVGNNNLTEFASSDNAGSSLRPQIWVSYTTNAQPYVDIITTNSNITSPINIGQEANFTIYWSDLESDPSQIFICNSSSITFPTGCDATTLCNTSRTLNNPQSCTYTSLQSNNRTSNFWVAVCDSTNCSTINQSNFYVNHFPNISIITPNGGETLNQSLGNYIIRFNVSDSDSDALSASLYYGFTQNSTTNTLISNASLISYCTDIDTNTATRNNCSYSWNTTGIYGSYFLTIILNDSYALSNDSSDNSFAVRSILDSKAPNITAQWIESGEITSGKMVKIYANVTDENLNTVWAVINYSTNQTIILKNTTSGMSELFNSSFIAREIGTYQFKVYANDSLDNINNTLPWVEFNITKPNSTTQNELSPSIALPYSVIKIKGEIESINPLVSVYAYLNVNPDFTFLQGYPQNLPLGNISENISKEAVWFLSTPINQSEYTFNIAYTDGFSNSWTSNNIHTNVTSTVGSDVYSLSIADYTHVAVTAPYTAQASFNLNGAPINADSTKISLFDPVGNLVIGPVAMVLKQTGIYNYTYNVPGGQTAGQWETIVNATKGGISYYANSFWKLVGALFDVRNIQIVNSSITNLNISVETENVGNTPVDLTLSWNLTRVDNDQVLDAGSDTFAVGASPITWYIQPETTYVGQVKITFIGVYSQTERAGAYEIFSTVSGTSGSTGGTGGSGGSSGGGGGGAGGGGGGGVGGPTTINATSYYNLQTDIGEEILVAKNIKQQIKIKVENIGKKDLSDVSLIFENLDENYYSISPIKISKINKEENAIFLVDFFVTDFIGEKEFRYIIKTNELIKEGQSKLNVLMPIDYAIAQLKKLKDRSKVLRSQAFENQTIKQIDNCDEIIVKIEENIDKQEILDAKNNIENAKTCLDIAQGMIKNKNTPYSFDINFGNYKVSYIIIIIAIAIILLLFIISYQIYKKLSLFFFIRRSEKLGPTNSAKKEDFEEKIKKIEERLKD